MDCKHYAPNMSAMYYARIIAEDEAGAKFICENLPLVAEMGLIKLDSFSDEQKFV